MIRKGKVSWLAVLGLVLILLITACTRERDPVTPPISTPTAAASETSGDVVPFPSVADMVQHAMPAVVNIVTGSVELSLFFDQIPQRDGIGSGVIFDSQGFIMTNNHVLGSAQYIQVTLPDGRAYDGQIIGRDTITDLAVIKIDADNLPMLSFADTGKVRIGDPVVAIGNALGLEGTPTVTVGVLSSLDRRIRTTSGLPLQGLLQTDASINPGNSGGPLLNMAGEIVGINTALDSDIPGIGYAIGMDTILPVVDLLLTKGKVARGFLGVTLATVTPSLVRRFGLGVDEGVLIVDVLHGTPADEAGLRSLDVVTIFDGTPVITHNEFIQLIRNRTIDQELNMTYVREGQEYTISVVLIERSQ